MEDDMDFPDFGVEKTAVNGEFVRNWKEYTRLIGKGGDLPAEKGRYHLFVSHSCPWSHKNVISLTLKGLTEIIGVTFVSKYDEKNGRGWKFEEGPDSLRKYIRSDGSVYLKDLYSEITHLVVRPTTPTLFDTKTNTVVSNNDEAIQKMFNSSFDEFLEPKYKSPNIDLFPSHLLENIYKMNTFLYENINNGVYRCGFATSQDAYENAVRRLFISLDWLEKRLLKRRFLFGNDVICDSDWRLFVTLIRFDVVYYVLFKTNLRAIRDYPNLFGWMKDMYQVDGVKETVRIEEIKKGYFGIKFINPCGIIPIGPENQNLESSHGRDKRFCKT